MPTRSALRVLNQQDSNAPAQDATVCKQKAATTQKPKAKRQVRFNVNINDHQRAPEMCLCETIIGRTNKGLPLVACDNCNSWHTFQCMALKKDASSENAKCLPCRKAALLGDLCNRVVAGRVPRPEQLLGVCNKLRVPLPQHPAPSDLLVRLVAFLIGAPQMRIMLASGECQMSDLEKNFAGPMGLNTGRSVQEAVLKELGFSDLKKACKLLNVKASTKEQIVAMLLCRLRGESMEQVLVTKTGTGKALAEKKSLQEAKVQKSIVAKLKKFKVAELRSECESQGLSKKGVKVELIQRLAEKLLQSAMCSRNSRHHPEGCGCDACDLELAALVQEFDEQMSVSMTD